MFNAQTYYLSEIWTN